MTIKTTKKIRNAAKDLAVSYHMYRACSDALDYSSRGSMNGALVWADLLDRDQKALGVEMIPSSSLTLQMETLRKLIAQSPELRG